MHKLQSGNHAIVMNPNKDQQNTCVDSMRLMLTTLLESWLATAERREKL